MYLIVLLLIVGGTGSSRSSLPVDDTDIVHDCSDFHEKDFTAGIWSFPDGVRSLTVRNCENFVLDITTGVGTIQSLRYLTVRDVKNCKITGWTHSGTSLPMDTTFADVESVTINVPLYGGREFGEGVLQFTNVTINRLKKKTITSSMKKLSITGSTVLLAEEGAVSFHGSLDSLLEVKDSFLSSVGGGSIACNVSRAVIERNHLIYAKEGSFSLKATNFTSTGNLAYEVEDCAIKLFTEDVQLEKKWSITENDWFNGKICLGLTPENMRKFNFNSSGTYLEDNMKDTGNFAGEVKAPTIVTRLGNRFLLLWLVAVLLLILMFPLAFYVKILISRFMDYAFPIDIKHKRLVNAECV